MMPYGSFYDCTMPNFRRLRVPGGTYFFTINLFHRKSDLLVTHIDLFRSAYRQVQDRHPFKTHAIVVLPDHLHTIWELPEDDFNFSTRIRLIKQRFTKSLPDGVSPISTTRKGERLVWQRRFWEHHIRDEEDYENHLNYIHFNPVKHGYVSDPDDWPHSSWHRWKAEQGREVNWTEFDLSEPDITGEL